MASSISVRSACSDSPFSASASSFASTSSSSSAHWKTARVRNLPRRGQIKAAIFASVFASIARFLSMRAANEEGLNAVSSPPGSPFEGDVDRDGRLSADQGLRLDLPVNSSPESLSGMPPSYSRRDSHTHAFDGRLHLQV